jgi:hypothetical protein
MALTQEFSTTQTVGFPSKIDLTDDSTGTDAAIVSRRIYLVDAEGEYVVPTGTVTDYVDFPIVLLATDEITIDCLTVDSALDITVQWLNVSNVVLYSKTHLKGFTLYNETFYYSLTQAQASQSSPPNITQGTTYYLNKITLRTNIDDGNQAITYGDDITTAQAAYDRATLMVTNEGNYF